MTNVPKIEIQVGEWATGPKSPGLMVLEHELSDDTIQAFMNIYAIVKANGWQIVSLAQLNDSRPTVPNLSTELQANLVESKPPQRPIGAAFRPKRFRRYWDEEAYRHFGTITVACMGVVLILCLLIFADTIPICRCCSSTRKKKLHID